MLINEIKEYYISLDSISRFLLIQYYIELNTADKEILNLLSRLNTIDVSTENMMKEDNIHFVCSQLMKFPNFKTNQQ